MSSSPLSTSCVAPRSVSTSQVLGVEKVDTFSRRLISGVNSRLASSSSSKPRAEDPRAERRGSQASSRPSALTSESPSSGAPIGKARTGVMPSCTSPSGPV